MPSILDHAIEENFNIAVERVKELPKISSDADLIKLYGLYKTATIGKVNVSKPGMLDIKGKRKYEGWKKFEHHSKEEAMSLYSRHVALLILNSNK